ncbi:glycohydrolase toxin TNT-related protein [Streptosporangium sp. NPDC087985]|uniref:TNT domain-containing protein n=1 Tax=Streptosporangium sp. NPDC087985 TaxID=3366196 RepID=UPI00381E20C5
MRHFRRRAPLAAAIGIVTAVLTGAAAQADTGPPPVPEPSATAENPAARPAAAGLTAPEGGQHPPVQVCGPPYLDNNPNLGPEYLPRTGPIGEILRGYRPLNGLSPQAFLDRYWDESVNGWRYPPDYGFAHSGGYSNGKPLIKTVTLPVGTSLDRFGGERGSFVAPLGGSYIGRALPPNNLNTFQGAPQYICNYHTYRVIKEFKVDGGPAVAAFQLAGKAPQYHLVSKYIPDAPQTSPEVSVEWLIANGYLARSN